MNWDKLKEVASWGQYLHWAQLNVDRWICPEDHTEAESIAVAYQFFASMYVVIEGWKQLKIEDSKIDGILSQNIEGVELLRRARNAVYHFQKEMHGEKMSGFANELGRDDWVIPLYHQFVRFLGEYPKKVYPFDEREEEFTSRFYDILGWKPEYE